MANNAIELAKSKLEELLNKQSQNSFFLTTLSNIYLSEARQRIYEQNQTDDKPIVNTAKLNACQKAIVILKPIITANSSYGVLLPYVQAHDCLGKLNKVPEFVSKLEEMQIKKYQF